MIVNNILKLLIIFAIFGAPSLKCLWKMWIFFGWLKVNGHNWQWWPSGLRRCVISLNWHMACLRSQVWIPIQDYIIDCSELEITCPYSNNRAPGGSCAPYDIDPIIDSNSIQPILKYSSNWQFNNNIAYLSFFIFLGMWKNNKGIKTELNFFFH